MTNLLARAIALALIAAAPLTAQGAPASGTDVLTRMHDAYAGKWYHTLTFVQKTTQHLPTGKDTISTWYESLRHTDATGTQLRIDFGSPSLGNGILFTADSAWVFKDGKLLRTTDQGNDFLPLIEGVYVQSVERTVRELHGTGIDLSRVTTGRWEGRSAWIVGVQSATDSATPQFWVDTERKVVVRMILHLTNPERTLDIHLDDYVPLGGGWLATRIWIGVDGAMIQKEEYSDWKSGIPLSDALFSQATWITGAHWATD